MSTPEIPLPVHASARVGTLALMASSVKTELTPIVLDLLQPDSSLAIRSACHVGPSILPYSCARLESLLSLQSSG